MIFFSPCFIFVSIINHYREIRGDFEKKSEWSVRQSRLDIKIKKTIINLNCILKPESFRLWIFIEISIFAT